MYGKIKTINGEKPRINNTFHIKVNKRYSAIKQHFKNGIDINHLWALENFPETSKLPYVLKVHHFFKVDNNCLFFTCPDCRNRKVKIYIPGYGLSTANCPSCKSYFEFDAELEILKLIQDE
tara:strand:- start:1343 stop:1705 length:363 start_codon:yes stop_codon:yes gene_type:complete